MSYTPKDVDKLEDNIEKKYSGKKSFRVSCPACGKTNTIYLDQKIQDNKEDEKEDFLKVTCPSCGNLIRGSGNLNALNISSDS